MAKQLETVWFKLKPEIKKELSKSSREYSSAKRLKYKLMSISNWWDLTIDEISSICTYGNTYLYDSNASDVIYGDKFLNRKK